MCESTGVLACGYAQRGTPTKPEAHWVALVTGYQRLLGLIADTQHLLPGEKQAFPQHPPPFPPHGKPSPFTLMQQMSPASVSTQAPTQQVLPPAHLNAFPCLLIQVMGGKRLRVSMSCSPRSAKSELSSLPHSPSAEHPLSPTAITELPSSIATAKTRPNAILKILIRFAFD